MHEHAYPSPNVAAKAPVPRPAGADDPLKLIRLHPNDLFDPEASVLELTEPVLTTLANLHGQVSGSEITGQSKRIKAHQRMQRMGR